AMRLQLREIFGADDADLERVRIAAVAAVAVRRDERAQHLPGVGVDDRDGFHAGRYLGGDGLRRKAAAERGQPRAEMMREELAETMLLEADAHEALEDVHVRIAVALDDDRRVLEDRDVPADHHTVAELAV